MEIENSKDKEMGHGLLYLRREETEREAEG